MKKRMVFVGLVLVALLGCYKAKDMPPCPPDAQWPDPCAMKARDAGSDAR